MKLNVSRFLNIRVVCVDSNDNTIRVTWKWWARPLAGLLVALLTALSVSRLAMRWERRESR